MEKTQDQITIEELSNNLAAKTEELNKMATETATKVKTLEAALTATKEELELTVKINEELSAKVEVLSKAKPAADAKSESKPAISKEVFEFDGVKYGFKKARIDHKGQIITPDEVLASKDLQEELVKRQSGMITHVA